MEPRFHSRATAPSAHQGTTGPGDLEPLAEVEGALLVVQVLHAPHPQGLGLLLADLREHRVFWSWETRGEERRSEMATEASTRPTEHAQQHTRTLTHPRTARTHKHTWGGQQYLKELSRYERTAAALLCAAIMVGALFWCGLSP